MLIRYFLRRNRVVLLTMLFAFTGIQAALAADEGSKRAITIVFTANCDGATIISTKDISNVLVVLGGDKFHEFEEGIDFAEGVSRVTLAPDIGFEGMIETVYINSSSESMGKVPGLPGTPGEPFHCIQPA